jgi:3',5'-cyclic AMP phosphodiesterase CpdA
LRVFAVTADAVQLDWHALAPGRHVVGAGWCTAEVEGDGGPGAVTLTGLAAGTTVPVHLDGVAVAGGMTATTLTPPPGPELARVATLSDLHIGERGFGFLPRCHSDRDPARAHPVVCLRAALAEIIAWQPDLLVLKGDLSDDDRPRQYALLAQVLAEGLDGSGVPLLVLPGNHDGGNHRHADTSACLAEHGLHLVDDVEHVDLPGLRVVAASSVWPGHDRGLLSPRLGRLTATLADAPASPSSSPGGEAGSGDARRPGPGPALLATHHQVMRTPFPTYLPPGIMRAEAKRVLRAVAEANPTTFVTSGHSHRHRRKRFGPLVLTEVGSPKDHPGTWAGYHVYADGIIQTVHRVEAPEAIRWTEETYRTVFTMWGRWSPGRLQDRCFVHLW